MRTIGSVSGSVVDLPASPSNIRFSRNRIPFVEPRGEAMSKLLVRLIWIGFLATAFIAQSFAQGGATGAITSAGFALRNISDIVVRVTETTRIIAKVSPQAVQQNIEVQGEVQAVDTSDATTGQAIEAGTIRALPLATQNFQQLLTLSTGAQSELNAASQLGRGNVHIEVNGQREDNNNYSIEGISATD